MKKLVHAVALFCSLFCHHHSVEVHVDFEQAFNLRSAHRRELVF